MFTLKNDINMKQSMHKLIFPIAIALHLIFRLVYSDGYDSKSIIDNLNVFEKQSTEIENVNINNAILAKEESIRL